MEKAKRVKYIWFFRWTLPKRTEKPKKLYLRSHLVKEINAEVDIIGNKKLQLLCDRQWDKGDSWLYD